MILLDAFSSREPASISLETALIGPVPERVAAEFGGDEARMGLALGSVETLRQAFFASVDNPRQ